MILFRLISLKTNPPKLNNRISELQPKRDVKEEVCVVWLKPVSELFCFLPSDSAHPSDLSNDTGGACRRYYSLEARLLDSETQERSYKQMEHKRLFALTMVCVCVLWGCQSTFGGRDGKRSGDANCC